MGTHCQSCQKPPRIPIWQLRQSLAGRNISKKNEPARRDKDGADKAGAARPPVKKPSGGRFHTLSADHLNCLPKPIFIYDSNSE